MTTFPNVAIAVRTCLTVITVKVRGHFQSACHHDNGKPSEEHHESGKADSIGAILSIDFQVVRELDFTQLIDDFAQMKCRRRDYATADIVCDSYQTELSDRNLLHVTCELSSVNNIIIHCLICFAIYV